jgi:ABC-type antimicrobial peptide transport system permease subunit
MNVVAADLASQHNDDKNWHIELQRLQDDIGGSTRSTLLMLAGAVAFVLLIACVNVANLLLARGAGRGREMTIRRMVGASRARLVRQMLTESVLLAALGAVLGLFAAYWGVRVIAAIGPEHVPRLRAISLDVHVVLATTATALLCGLLFGLVPALAASTHVRREGPPRGSGALIVAEVALTFVLLVGAGFACTGRRCAREAAIRYALGATPLDTFRMMTGEEVRLIIAGLLVGALTSAALTRVLAGLLYGVGATDPWTFAAVAITSAQSAPPRAWRPACGGVDGAG